MLAFIFLQRAMYNFPLTTAFGFCLTSLSLYRQLKVMPGPPKVPQKESLGLLLRDFYRLHALPVAQQSSEGNNTIIIINV